MFSLVATSRIRDQFSMSQVRAAVFSLWGLARNGGPPHVNYTAEEGATEIEV
jgi:hypothetical protein